jgi:hypothetical protein
VIFNRPRPRSHPSSSKKTGDENEDEDDFSFKARNYRRVLDLHARRDFRVGQNGQIVERVFKEAAKRQP